MKKKSDWLVLIWLCLIFLSTWYVSKTYTFNKLRMNLRDNGVILWQDGHGGLTYISMNTNNAFFDYGFKIEPDTYQVRLTNCGKYLFWEVRK